jgi:Tfp pilus assembly protein PilF
LLPALVIICVGLYAYRNSLRGPFVFDDVHAILNNPTIHQLWPPWQVLSPPQADTAVSGRGVVNLSLAVNYALGGLNVWGYHVVNLAIHILGALVLYGVVRRTLLCASLRDRYGDEARWLALAVALIWVVHPLQTESVTYLIQRTESLMGFFFLLTLYCVTRGAMSSDQRGWYAAAIVSCALGMGSKEVMVVAPLTVLLYDRAFLSRSFREALRARAALYAGLSGCWLILVGLVASGSHAASAGFGLSVTPWEYAWTQPGVIVHYLRLSFWPSPLVLDYYDWPVARTVATVVPAGALVLALLVATLWAVRRRPHLGFLGGWFFLILAPTSSVMPLIGEFAAERRMYLPLAAVIALVVIGWHVVLGGICRRLGWGSGRRRIVEVVVLVAMVATLAQLTVRRNEDYRSEVTLWSDVVAKRPNNARGHYNLGITLATQGKLNEAIAQYSEALRIRPNFLEAHNNLGIALATQGKLDEGIAQYSEALRIYPADAEAHTNLGNALITQGKLDEAMAHYSEALRINPNSAQAHNNLGNALKRQGKLDEAITHYSEAVRIYPAFKEAHYNLATALARDGRTQEAIGHLETALKLDPGFQQARRALAQLTSFSAK